MRSLQHEPSSGKKHSTEEGRKKGALSRRKKWLLLLGALSFVSGAVQLGGRAKHARKRQKTDPRTVAPYCQNLARRQNQPYDDDYRLRDQRINARGPQFAFYSWRGKIQRSEFEQTRQTNFSTLAVKVVDNLLYATELWNQTDLPSSAAPRRDALVFQLLLTLHFYDIPDLEMTFNLEDDPLCGLPFAGYNVDSRCTDKAGFTIPSYEVFKSALGPKQTERYYSCLDRMFPLKKRHRIMKAMWRGSTTGTPTVSRSSLPMSERFQLISLGDRRPDLLDVGFTTYVQLDEGDPEILEIMQTVAPLKPFLPIDDFNKYAVILDLDGNAWSDRFSKLLFYTTPILKQQSPWKDYFAPLVEPLISDSTFHRNLSDLVPKIEHILELYQDSKGIEQLQQRGRDQRTFAQEHFSQLGVLRATAYTLTVYSEKQSWKVTLEENDRRVTPDMHHSYYEHFPRELIEDAFHDFIHDAPA